MASQESHSGNPLCYNQKGSSTPSHNHETYIGQGAEPVSWRAKPPISISRQRKTKLVPLHRKRRAVHARAPRHRQRAVSRSLYHILCSQSAHHRSKTPPALLPANYAPADMGKHLKPRPSPPKETDSSISQSDGRSKETQTMGQGKQEPSHRSKHASRLAQHTA